jgi:hypothetical protein
VFYAQICKNSQTFFFFFTKAESKMFAVIARKEFAIDFLPPAGVIGPGYSVCD